MDSPSENIYLGPMMFDLSTPYIYRCREKRSYACAISTLFAILCESTSNTMLCVPCLARHLTFGSSYTAPTYQSGPGCLSRWMAHHAVGRHFMASTFSLYAIYLHVGESSPRRVSRDRATPKQQLSAVQQHCSTHNSSIYTTQILTETLTRDEP